MNSKWGRFNPDVPCNHLKSYSESGMWRLITPISPCHLLNNVNSFPDLPFHTFVRGWRWTQEEIWRWEEKERKEKQEGGTGSPQKRSGNGKVDTINGMNCTYVAIADLKVLRLTMFLKYLRPWSVSYEGISEIFNLCRDCRESIKIL